MSKLTSHKVTALLLIAVAVLTQTGFTALASVFNYPDVLNESSGVVLDRFRQHQGSVSLWFSLLAFSAAMFAPIAIGVGRLSTDRWMKRSVRVGVAAAIVQTIGLLRWPILVPGFAASARSVNPQTAADAEAHFRLAGTLLGTVVGETLGYILTAAWTVLVLMSLRSRFAGRVFVALGAVSASLIVLGVLSSLELPVIDTANFVGYILWVLWLLWMAVQLLRRNPGQQTDATDRRSPSLPADDPVSVRA